MAKSYCMITVDENGKREVRLFTSRLNPYAEPYVPEPVKKSWYDISVEEVELKSVVRKPMVRMLESLPKPIPDLGLTGKQTWADVAEWKRWPKLSKR